MVSGLATAQANNVLHRTRKGGEKNRWCISGLFAPPFQAGENKRSAA